MRRIIVCGLPRSTIFFNMISKRQDLQENVIEHKMCVLIFCTDLYEKFPVLRRIERDMTINTYWSLYKVPAILVRFKET
jgi:phenylalanine-4-hydroxylase